MFLVETMVAMPTNCYIVKTSDYFCLDKQKRQVWRHRSKAHPYYLVWDSLHGEIEVFYIKTLKHRAVYHPNGDYKSGPVKGRSLSL